MDVDDEVVLRLPHDHALVLFDWLSRSNAVGAPASFVDQAEQRVFWDLEAALERRLADVLSADYAARVGVARTTTRDGDG